MSQQTPMNTKRRRQPRAWLFALLFFAVGSWAANEVIEIITEANSDDAPSITTAAVAPTEVTTTTTPPKMPPIKTAAVTMTKSNDNYVSVEEILDEGEAEAPDEEDFYESPGETESSDYVNLDEILYGTTDEEVISRIKSKEGDIEPPTRESLESEMQDLKQEVLAINRDLLILEEDLLFPAGTQVNVFVSIDASDYFSLDGVTLKINNRPINNHLYTNRELQALYRGAVQRLYSGNLPTGEHELVMVVTGRGPKGRDFRRAVSIDFTKENGTKYVELKIRADELRQQPTFQLREWD